ncbi:hypothetical protein RhiirC2_790007 [Rhizophagus irregularis]|uniref:Uncharacterized protein n=1 Tax=Rhizophagus irregularis TaxID=588596 RepID=A0A2N1MM28_9GLOM|nr:hypothetical protein RhiirC2_790007 [Rhizophagus irregularis]
MDNKLTKLVTRVRNIALNISFSFNNKQKNQQNSQKKSKNPENITKKDSHINKDDVHFNQNLDNIDNLQQKTSIPNCIDWIHNINQFTFVTHNIQGGSKKKQTEIIEMMINQQIDFLHICETNE